MVKSLNNVSVGFRRNWLWIPDPPLAVGLLVNYLTSFSFSFIIKWWWWWWWCVFWGLIKIIWKFPGLCLILSSVILLLHGFFPLLSGRYYSLPNCFWIVSHVFILALLLDCYEILESVSRVQKVWPPVPVVLVYKMRQLDQIILLSMNSVISICLLYPWGGLHSLTHNYLLTDWLKSLCCYFSLFYLQ